MIGIAIIENKLFPRQCLKGRAKKEKLSEVHLLCLRVTCHTLPVFYLRTCVRTEKLRDSGNPPLSGKLSVCWISVTLW